MAATVLALLFALATTTYAQYMSSWGSSGGFSNQMQMPMPYTHMPYHHLREAAIEGMPYAAAKTEGGAIMPVHMYRAKIPSRVGLQDYSLMNVNAPDHDDMTEHMIYRQGMAELKRPMVGVLSLLTSPMPMSQMAPPSSSSMMGAGTKSGSMYQDSAADELMTCVGLDMTEPLKVHATEPRIIINRGIPYYTQTMHKIKQ